jgi:hypothetical protein
MTAIWLYLSDSLKLLIAIMVAPRRPSNKIINRGKGNYMKQPLDAKKKLGPKSSSGAVLMEIHSQSEPILWRNNF